MGEHVGHERPRTHQQVRRVGRYAEPFEEDVVVHPLVACQQEGDVCQADCQEDAAVDIYQAGERRAAAEIVQDAPPHASHGILVVCPIVHSAF